MPPSDADIASLSMRQKEILRLVGQYMQAKEVARELDIAESTVRTHMTTARRRLDVTTSREAARLLLEYERTEGIINDEGPPRQRMAEPAELAANSGHEQDLRSERTFFHDPMGGSGTGLEDARIPRQAAPDSRRAGNHASARPVLWAGTGGVQYDRSDRLADRRWALFERRLETLNLWQWFGLTPLVAISMTAAAEALVQGAVEMFRLLHDLQR